jgi:DNA-binding NarL/FixJ family response regulator
VSDGETLTSEVLRLKPDVIVTDITVPVMNGIDAIYQLRIWGHPLDRFFEDSWGDEFVIACRAEGALGYVLKTNMTTQLIPAIRAVLARES